MWPPVYHHNAFVATHALGQMMYHTSWAQVHELLRSHCGDNQEDTLFSWLHIYYTHFVSVRSEHSEHTIERLNGIQWLWVQILLRPTFYSYFKESISGDYHMYQLIPLHSCDYLQNTSIKINVATDEGKQPKWIVTLNKRWNWSSCTKLALSAS